MKRRISFNLFFITTLFLTSCGSFGEAFLAGLGNMGNYSNGYGYGYGTYNQAATGVYTAPANYTNTDNSSSDESTPSRSYDTPTKHTCSLCKGKGRIVYDTYPPMFGTEDYKVKCNECGGWFLKSTGHSHITCTQCHGKGYFTT